jgi:WD40 repeat protein
VLGSGPAVARVLAFDSAQERLAAGFADGSVIVFSIADCAPTAQWQAHESDVWALAWRGDRLLTGGGDGSVRLFMADGTPVASTAAQQHRPITALAVHPDGHSALAAGGGPAPEVVEIHLPGV